MLEKERLPRIGDIYFMHFTGTENEQSGWRPGLVFQNNLGNRFSPNIIALPLTSSIKKWGQPTHVMLSADENGLMKDSMVLCENPQIMSKKNLGKYLTTVSDKAMSEIAIASLLATSAISYIDPAKLGLIRERAAVLNA